MYGYYVFFLALCALSAIPPSAIGQQYQVDEIPNIDISSLTPISFAIFHNELYFRGFANSTGYELFKYNGNGVSLVQDITPGPVGANPLGLSVYNNELYFSAYMPATGQELFKYDGTDATLVHDHIAGNGDSQT